MALYVNMRADDDLVSGGTGAYGQVLSDLAGTPFMQNQHFPTGFTLSNFRTKYLPWAVATGAPASGTAWATPISLPGGFVVSNITFVSGTTAGATLTHQWFGLADSSLKIVATTADDTSTAWGASTAKTLAITKASGATAGAYKVPSTTPEGRATLYYAVFLVAASTVPTIHGITSSAWASGQVPKSGVTDLTSATTPSLTDSSVTLAITANTHVPLVGVS